MPEYEFFERLVENHGGKITSVETAVRNTSLTVLFSHKAGRDELGRQIDLLKQASPFSVIATHFTHKSARITLSLKPGVGYREGILSELGKALERLK
ncbi:MAG: hypothetical protein V1835_06320 [Candidatus Micrarchaeota archaeon]